MLTNVSMDFLSTKYNSSVLVVVAEFLCSHNSSRSRPTVDLYCREFPIHYPMIVQIFVGMAFVALILLALVGNGLVMWIISRHRVMHQSFYYFLFNLALADFLIALLNVGTSWAYNFYYDWWFGDFCPFNHYFGVVPTCVCVFTMMIVSWDRCAAVSNPLGKRHLSRTTTILVLLGVWLLAAVIGLPSLLYSRVERRYFYSSQHHRLFTQNLCVNVFAHEKEYNVLLLIINYVIPLFVLLATFLKIALSLRDDNKDGLLNSSNSSGHLIKRRRAVKMLALVMAIFIICWLPYQLYHAVLERYISNMSTAAYTYMAVYWLAMSTAMYNPVIYFFMNKRFRTGFQYAFRFLPFVEYSSLDYHMSELCNGRTRSALEHSLKFGLIIRLSDLATDQQSRVTVCPSNALFPQPAPPHSTFRSRYITVHE